MEIRVLNYFVETANQKSMTKAAGKLHVTQPTLSKQLKDLEDELGQKLFARSNYSVNLTHEGELLYKRAVDILSIVDKTEAEFKRSEEHTSELQSRQYLVCRLLLEKKKNTDHYT